MRRPPITVCIKCGTPIVLSNRRSKPFEHPLQKLVRQLAPTLCTACRLRSKRPHY